MRNTSVLLAHSVAKIGGAEKVTLDILQALSGSEFRPVVGALEAGPFLEEARSFGAKTTVLNLKQPKRSMPFKNLKSLFSGLSLFKKESIGLIHTGDIFIARILLPIAAKKNVPLICHMHFPPDDGALEWVFSKYGKKANITFLYCSQELMSACQNRLNVFCPNAKHQVIHNGVNTDEFKSYPIPLTRVLPESKTNIGIIANLQKRKGHDELLKAAALLLDDYDNLQFHVIGGDLFGETREGELKELASSLNITERVTFHGQVKNVKPYLNELDIYVCASHEEAFPISILEAMAFGLPIATTNVNGIPEALTNNENALLFDAHDIDAQVVAIKTILSYNDLRKRLKYNTRKKVEQHFSHIAFQERVLASYGSTLIGYEN